MKAKHWLLAGFGCFVASVLTAISLAIHWMGRLRSFAVGDTESVHHFTAADPFHSFGPIVVGAGLANVLFFGGIIMVIVGFIALAKEPKPKQQPLD